MPLSLPCSPLYCCKEKKEKRRGNRRKEGEDEKVPHEPWFLLIQVMESRLFQPSDLLWFRASFAEIMEN
uniref:Uncharacterized protein n=1 Tax=Arundo donax TaxID=35708 RepID=A0A0A9AEM2_ARUDO